MRETLQTFVGARIARLRPDAQSLFPPVTVARRRRDGAGAFSAAPDRPLSRLRATALPKGEPREKGTALAAISY